MGAPVKPFEFYILFLSFIYTLSLTHLLFAATRMLRHRRDLKLSWPHALWMATVLIVVFANWIALWDFHGMRAIRPAVRRGRGERQRRQPRRE